MVLLKYRLFERCEALIAAHWSRARKGDIGAGRLILKALEAEAKLYRLDAPVQVEATRTHHVERVIEEMAIEAGMSVDSVMDEALAILLGAESRHNVGDSEP